MRRIDHHHGGGRTPPAAAGPRCGDSCHPKPRAPARPCLHHHGRSIRGCSRIQATTGRLHTRRHALSPPSTAAPAVLVLVLAVVSTASAAPTFTVTTTTDSLGSSACTAAACSLRSAVTAADQPANAGATIVLPANSAPYTLTSGDGGQLQVTEPVTIQGAGPQSSIIHGDGNHRVLLLDLSSAGTVTLSGLEIAAGIDRSGEGGGIDSISTASGVQVDLSNVDVHANGADAAAAAAGSGDDGRLRKAAGSASSGPLRWPSPTARSTATPRSAERAGHPPRPPPAVVATAMPPGFTSAAPAR